MPEFRPLLFLPEPEAQLLSQVRQFSGHALGKLTAMAGIVIPKDLKRDKGWIGILLEIWFGASTSSRPEQDSVALGVELKMVPVNSFDRPLGVTFACMTPLIGNIGVAWKTSCVWHKLKRIPWILIEGECSTPLAEHRVGSSLLWSPNEKEDRQLRLGWKGLMNIVVLGHVERITARHGEVL